MRLPGRTDYALRAALELAAGGDGPLTTEELGERQGIPRTYLRTILADLRRAGLIRGRRGVDGGWSLATTPDAITLGEVIRAVDGALAQVAGTRPEDLHYSGAAEGLPTVIIALRAAEREILDSVTLADVVSGEFPERIRGLAADPAAWH